MHIIALDIETTGFHPENDKIIEIRAALVNLETRKIEAEFETFINPGVPIPHVITNLTGITDQDTGNAPTMDDIRADLIAFIKEYPIMGHNIGFDISFLESNGLNLPNVRLDSMDIAHIAIPKAESYSLEIVAEKLGMSKPGQHRALKDVKDNIEVMFKLLDIYFAKNSSEELSDIIEKSLSPWKDIFKYAIRNHNTQIVAYDEQTKQAAKEAAKCEVKPNTLQEVAPHEIEQIIPENSGKKTIIAVTGEKNLTILNPSQYLDRNLFRQLTDKESLSPEETVFALKILPLLRSANYQLSSTEVSFPSNIKNLWFDYCYTSYPQDIIKTLKVANPIILTHQTLARLAKSEQLDMSDANLIIDDIDEFHNNVQRAFTMHYSERRFADSSLSEGIKDRIAILFGYIGMMYEKHGQSFALELCPYHFATMEWQKISDLATKIAEEAEDNSEESSMLRFLEKSKNGSQNLRIEIMLAMDGSPILKITPLNIGTMLAEKIWPIPSTLSLIGTAITYKGESPAGTYLKKLLCLPEDFRVETDNSYIDTENVDMPPAKDPLFTTNADNYLLQNLDRIEKPVFILANSQKAAGMIHHKLALPFKEKGIAVMAQGASGGIGKIRVKSTKDPENTVLVGTYDFWRLLSMEAGITNLKTLIIYKLPFPPPGTTPFKEPEDFNAFKEYALPITGLKIKKIAKTAQKTILLDSRITI